MWQYIIPAAASLISTAMTNRSNKKQAESQTEFQRDMSNTAYQRQVADMQAAGISPVLSAKMGGASTPVGAKAEIENPVGPAVASAGQAMGVMTGLAQIEQSKASAQQSIAAAKKLESETMDETLNSALLAARIRKEQGLGDSAKARGYVDDSLRAYEIQRGIANAESAQSAAQLARASWQDRARDVKFGADLKGLDINRAKAESKFWGSDFGDVSPFLRDILQVFRTFSAVSGRR